MENKLVRTVIYVLSRLLIVALIVGLVISAFYSSMKTSNLYFVIQDALKARLDIILLKTDVEEKSKFFSYDYLRTAEYQQMRSSYNLYKISGYSHKFEFKNLFVFPWQKKKTVTVKEAVYTINGELDTTQMTKADAMANGIYNVPQWKPSIYSVTLIYENGSWIVDKVTRKGDFDYSMPQTPSLTKEEIDALRTPSPAPTPTLQPGEELSGERPAKISNPIRGDKVNVRFGPATEYEILEELENGARVTVLDESDGWYIIRTASGIEGYVSGYYILFD